MVTNQEAQTESSSFHVEVDLNKDDQIAFMTDVERHMLNKLRLWGPRALPLLIFIWIAINAAPNILVRRYWPHVFFLALAIALVVFQVWQRRAWILGPYKKNPNLIRRTQYIADEQGIGFNHANGSEKIYWASTKRVVSTDLNYIFEYGGPL